MRHYRRLILGRLGSVAPVIALAFGGGALYLFAEDDLLAGCVLLAATVPATWLAGLWVMPGGADAYMQRTSRIIKAGFSDVRQEGDKRRARLSAITDMIARLDPPEELKDFHIGVIETLREFDSIQNVAIEELEKTARRRFELRARVNGFLDDLRSAPRDVVYVQGAGKLLREWAAITVDTAEIEQKLDNLDEKLRKVKAPPSLADRHAVYVAAFDDYIQSMISFYRANKGDDIDSIGITTNILITKHQNIMMLAEQHESGRIRSGDARGA